MGHTFRLLAAFLVAAGSLAVTSGGCELLSSVDRTKIPGTGGTGGASSTGGATSTGGVGGMPTTTTTTTTGGAGGMPPACDGGAFCAKPADCPAVGACLAPTCVIGCCDTTVAASGTACTDSSGGKVCDSDGNCVACNVANDCPAEATACITSTCTAGACGTANAASGTSCTDSGGKLCDGAGHCVACLSELDCPSTGTVCVSPTCANHACGTTELAVK